MLNRDDSSVPIEYVLDRGRRRLTITGRDPADVSHVLAWLARQTADGTWAYSALDDLRLVTLHSTMADVQLILEPSHYALGGARPAGTGGGRRHKSTLFGMARVYAAVSDMAAGDVGVFYDLVKAERWLGERKRAT